MLFVNSNQTKPSDLHRVLEMDRQDNPFGRSCLSMYYCPKIASHSSSISTSIPIPSLMVSSFISISPFAHKSSRQRFTAFSKEPGLFCPFVNSGFRRSTCAASLTVNEPASRRISSIAPHAWAFCPLTPRSVFLKASALPLTIQKHSPRRAMSLLV